MRIFIRLLTVAFAVLVYWLLQFLVRDLESIPGPDYRAIEERTLAPDLVEQRARLERQIAQLDRTIQSQREEQKIVGDGSQNLQRTINQLIELQRLGVQRQSAISDAEKADLSASLNLFLASQSKYEELNKSLATLSSNRATLDQERQDVDRQLQTQRETARKEYDRLLEKHRLKLAAYELSVLVPLLLLGGYFLLRKRDALYAPLFLAFSLATLVKVGLVVHEYFPSRYFKYILTLLLLGLVARLLVHFLRAAAFPKIELLLRQYREAYERYLCPICEYPIRTGPRKFLYWTRRTVHKVLPVASPVSQEAYTCPNCGTSLFEPCPACAKVRHALLPYCEHCGTKKTEEPTSALSS